ncbi:MAG: DegT/DnrJ/EryC1/StrS family aminotransferase [Lachnospiraceae bacterium]|nr:DegT/DnrJ/EryC1/StrS family aminotransferase [Lachnospiraceae bacterium]
MIDKEVTGFDHKELRLALEAGNVESRPLWKPLHLQPVFADCPAYTDGTSEGLFGKGLCLPDSPWVTDEDVEYICNIIRSLYRK